MADVPKIILQIETSREFGRGLLRGIIRYARLHGPWAFFSRAGVVSPEIPQLYRLNERQADGIIARNERATFIFTRAQLGKFRGRQSRQLRVSDAVTDDSRIGTMAAEHLLNLGHRNFAYCGYHFTVPAWSKDRRRSFCETVERAGYRGFIYAPPKEKKNRIFENEQTRIARWLRTLPLPVGLMACNDDRGQHVVQACKAIGLHVPEDVAIIGVDNDEVICNLADPPLSSVALDTETGGYRIAENLDKLMSGRIEKPGTIVIHPSSVVVRQSSELLAIGDREVAEAVRFIRQHARQMIRVTDLLNVVPLSQRALEKRFRKALGRSISAEIRRIRARHISDLLSGSELGISEIAQALGYSSIQNISRDFKRETGTTPLAYRRNLQAR